MKLAAVFLAWLVAGCGSADGRVTIRTLDQPYAVCDQAAVRGTLVADAIYGLALANGGNQQGAVWPFGYSARRESGTVVLLDQSSHVVAREGDHILAAGAIAADGATYVECDIQVNPRPTPGPT